MRTIKTIQVLSVAALAATGAPPSVAQAQTAATANVVVEGAAAGTPLNRIWAYHGYDEINYTTLPEGRALLDTLGALHTTPPHIRAHFYLNTGNGVPGLKWGSTNAYTVDAAGTAVYDWTLLDGITDALTGAGTLPFVEIGFMPQDLSVHPVPYANSAVRALDSGCFYPPKDYAKWEALISTWSKHTSAKYPSAETQWQWELWNEPELSYWHGTPAEYDKLYDYTEAGLHQAMPNASLGGPASYNPGTSFLQQFLQHCATGVNAVSGGTGARLDMITFHAKGGTAVVGTSVQMNMGNQLRLHRTGFSTVASFPQFKQKPIVVTEGDPDGCAACQGAPDAYRQVPAYGAYEVEMMKRSLDLGSQLGVNVHGVLAWAFMFPNQPYFAGFRVLSTNGIALPVLNAFKLLGSLSGSRLPVTSSGALALDAVVANSVRGQPDIDAMATRNGQDIQVLVWNYHDDIVAATPSPVHLTVNVPASFGARATVTHLRMDDTHGNPYAVWVSQGSPAAPSATQLTQLRAAADALTLQPAQAVDVIANAVSLDFTLPRSGVSLVTFSPVVVGGSDASVASGADASTGDSASGSPIGDATFPELDGSLPVFDGWTAPTVDAARPANDGPSPTLAEAGMTTGASAAESGTSTASGCSCATLGFHANPTTGGPATACLVLPLAVAIRRRRKAPTTAG